MAASRSSLCSARLRRNSVAYYAAAARQEGQLGTSAIATFTREKTVESS
jgi:hypothetical protein